MQMMRAVSLLLLTCGLFAGTCCRGAFAVKDGGEVVIPSGRYTLSHPIVIDGQRDITIRGKKGAAIVLLPEKWSGDDRVAFVLRNCENVTFSNLQFVVDAPASSVTAIGGVRAIGGKGSLDLLSCSFVGLGGSALEVRPRDDGQSPEIFAKGCSCSALGAGGFVFGANHVLIEDCRFDRMRGAAVEGTGTKDVELRDSTVTDGPGIRIDHGTDVRVIANRFVRCGDVSVSITSSKRVALSGNVYQECGVNDGVTLRRCSGLVQR